MSSNSYAITGRVLVVEATKQVTEKFSKRCFVVETESGTKYPQEIQIEATGAQCSLLDPIKVGDEVKVECNLRGRKWDGPNGTKWFIELRAWKIDVVGAGAAPSRMDQMPGFGDGNADSDLPF